MLLYAWDPIGVAGVSQAANEYDGYVLPLLGKLREGATATEVAAYLNGVETEQMGLSPPATQNVEVGQRIARWYENSTSSSI